MSLFLYGSYILESYPQFIEAVYLNTLLSAESLLIIVITLFSKISSQEVLHFNFY